MWLKTWMDMLLSMKDEDVFGLMILLCPGVPPLKYFV